MRLRLIKALNNRLKVKFMQLEIDLLHVCEAKGILQTTDLPEVILVTIVLSVSYALAKP